MSFFDFEEQIRFQQAWESIEIARPVQYSLFTFGESDLPYYLVCNPRSPAETVTIRKGEIKITRPLILTPDNVHPEFRNFFENAEEDVLARFFMQRTAAFSNLQFENLQGPSKIVTDSVEEAVAKLNRQLDRDEEDRVAILCAPSNLAGFAAFRYAAERVIRSAPDNINELRERGFLP
ncbi:MAG: hypothetical protein JSS02_26535 [Planctomycetes bacterium]|nr:hypothetical protein [Planctomycetota bacterium]